jgi:hypothetical protein
MPTKKKAAEVVSEFDTMVVNPPRLLTPDCVGSPARGGPIKLKD